MAKAKKKNTVKITSVKENNAALKKGVKTTIVSNKKPRQVKKKLESVNVPKKTNNMVGTNKPKKTAVKKTIKPIETENKVDVLTPEELIAKKKERNRKKYEKGQKKYRDNIENKSKKKIVVEDNIEEKNEEVVPKDVNQEEVTIRLDVKEEHQKEIVTDEEIVKEEVLLKKTTEIESTPSSRKIKEIVRKEKRKTNRKTSGFTQTLNNLKEISATTINDVLEKTGDHNIPTGKTYDEKSKRSKRLIKEAIIYAIMLTIIDVLCIVFLDYFNFLRLFDVKALNIAVTVLIALIFNFFVAFMVDYFVTNIWLNKKRKKKDGEQNGDSGTNEKKHRKNIKDKKRK